MPADIVTPSAFSPAAAKTVTPAAPVKAPVAPVVATPPATPVESPEVLKLRADLIHAKRLNDAIAKKQRDGFAKEKEGFGPKLTRLGELEKLHAQAKLNPEAFLKGVYGDDWYDRVVQTKVNGGAPTAGVLADEIAKMEEKFEAKLKARDEESAKQSEAQKAQGLVDARRQVANMAGQFWTAKGSEFPLIEALGTSEQIAQALADRVESHYLSTVKRDESGRIVVDGEVLPVQTIAAQWHSHLAKAHEKYAELQKKVAPPSIHDQPSRSTLSNELTGTTPGPRQPATSIEEKRARAEAAYLAARKPQS